MGRNIEVVPYDPDWPRAFALEAQALRGVFGSSLRSVHHIGSTSVPQLPAKPVIDILVVLDETSTVGRFDEPMRALGYQVRGEELDAGGTPGRYYYSKPPVGPRTHHTHVCPEGHPQIREFLVFPEYLRRHPAVAGAYAKLKRQALTEGARDNVEYMARKAPWVHATIQDALDWSAATDNKDPRSTEGSGAR